MKCTNSECGNDLVELPYGERWYVCSSCKCRYHVINNKLLRDYYGEESWSKMGSYKNFTYEQVFETELNYALSKR